MSRITLREALRKVERTEQRLFRQSTAATPEPPFLLPYRIGHSILRSAPAKIKAVPATSVTTSSTSPVRSPFLTIVLAWLLPGAGHLLLGRRIRGAIVFATVLVSFAIGLLMRGPMFQPGGAGDLLSRAIQYGGFIGDLAAGLLYFVAVWFGYAAPDQAGHMADYGSKFLVAAGLLNILAIVDAYEIAVRQKD